jgi:predicted kinase
LPVPERPPTERAPPEAYSAAADAAVFDEVFAVAATLLRAGRAVVLDATFLRPETRARAEALAAAAGAPFHGLWLDGPAAVLEARVAGRTGDASDADLAVLHAQLARDPGPMSWTPLDAAQPAERAAEGWLAGLGG